MEDSQTYFSDKNKKSLCICYEEACITYAINYWNENYPIQSTLQTEKVEKVNKLKKSSSEKCIKKISPSSSMDFYYYNQLREQNKEAQEFEKRKTEHSIRHFAKKINKVNNDFTILIKGLEYPIENICGESFINVLPYFIATIKEKAKESKECFEKRIAIPDHGITDLILECIIHIVSRHISYDSLIHIVTLCFHKVKQDTIINQLTQYHQDQYNRVRMCLLFCDSSSDFITICRHIGTISSYDLEDIYNILKNDKSENNQAVV